MDQILFVGGFDAQILALGNMQGTVLSIEDPAGALARVKADHDRLAAVIMSLRMAGMDGLDAMEEVHRVDPEIPVIISTHDTRVTTIVEAMQRGAYNYVFEPQAAEALPYLLTRALAYTHAIREKRALQAALQRQDDMARFVGISGAAAQVRSTLERVADSALPVLLAGESGTGKEVAARILHSLSPRRKGPFVAVNCGALSPTLLEAELFGFRKGAFTGADAAHEGLFEQAHNGTLFLDEIGVTDLNFQAKLLRVLEDGEVRRVGDNAVRRVNVRITAATNADLDLAVAGRTFREDLLYRLNVVTIRIPPLRERREDIPVLAHYFLDLVRKTESRVPETIAAPALRRLEMHDWPGNARELRNVIERAVLMGNRKSIQVHDLPEALTRDVRMTELAAGQGLAKTLEEVESRLIAQALRETEGNRSRAAEKLRIKRTTLVEKMKRLGIR